MENSAPRPRLALPAVFTKRSFTSQEAATADLDPQRLRVRGATSPSRGIWLPPDAGDSLLVARAVSQMYPDGAISHLTAARIWGMPLPFLLPGAETVHLTRRPGTPPIGRTGVVGHRRRFEPTDVVRLPAGTLVMTRLRTALDLASMLAIDDLIAVLDHLLRWPYPGLERRPRDFARRPFVTPEELTAYTASVRGLRGAGPLRAAAVLARVGSDSPKETELRLACMRTGLPEPVLNQPIRIPEADHSMVHVLHTPDLQWPDFGVTGEYEGRHHSAPEQVERDVGRADSLREFGWEEVRIVSVDMRAGAARAVHKISQALRRRGWEG